MTLFGTTRSRVCRNHALICPDSFVKAPLPGWEQTETIVLISPHMVGARFSQYLAIMAAGGVAAPAKAGVERVVFVLDGEVFVRAEKGGEHLLTKGGFAFLPADGGTSDTRFPRQRNAVDNQR